MTTIQRENDNLSLQDEILNQEELNKCENSIQEKEVVNKELLVCRYISDTEIEYNNKIYNVKCYNSNVELSYGDIIYVPIFVINFNTLDFLFTPGWFSDKKDAENMLEEYSVLHGKIEDDIFNVYDIKNKKLQRFAKNYDTDFWLDISDNLIAIPILFQLGFGAFSSRYIYDNHLEYFESQFSFLIEPLTVYLYVTFVILPLLYAFIYLYITSKLRNGTEKFYKINDINIDYSPSDNYKIVNADVNIDSRNIELYSEELDCYWTFKKDDMHRLPDDVINLLRNYTGNNSIVLSVRDSWSVDSIFQSENNKWWIESIE